MIRPANSKNAVFTNTIDVPYCPFKAKVSASGITVHFERYGVQHPRFDDKCTVDPDVERSSIETSEIINPTTPCESIQSPAGLYHQNAED